MTFPRPLSRIFANERPRTVGCIAALILLAGPASLAAQVLYGSMVGNITDSSGGAVPGATVTITHSETGASHEAVTDANGTYRFSTVQPGHVHHDGQADRLPHLHPRERAGNAEQHHTSRRCDAGRAAQRERHRLGRYADAPDGPRRGAIRAEGAGAGESAGIPQPELSVHVPRPARIHSAGGGALGAVQPVAGARLQRQRREPQLEQHPHRRREHDQHLAAARGGLRPRARIARDRQRGDQQLRRRAGTGRRIRHQRADQERHEHSSTDRRSSTTRTSTCEPRTTSRPPARRRASGGTTSTAAPGAARSSTTSCSTS